MESEGIGVTRPLCGIQRDGNRKERLRVREAGASAAGRGQRPYASFPDQSPKRNPPYVRSTPIISQGAKRHLTGTQACFAETNA